MTWHENDIYIINDEIPGHYRHGNIGRYLESGPCKAQVVCSYLSRVEQVLGKGEGKRGWLGGAQSSDHICV